MWAAENAHIAIVQLWVERGAEVNRVDRYSQTALICCLKHGFNVFERIPIYVRIVTTLLAYGADVQVVVAQE